MDCPVVIGAARGYITGVVTSAATDFEFTKYPLTEVQLSTLPPLNAFPRRSRSFSPPSMP